MRTRTPQEDERIKRITYEFQHGRPDGLEFNVSCRFEMADTDRLSSEQLSALMGGIAKCLAAASPPAALEAIEVKGESK